MTNRINIPKGKGVERELPQEAIDALAASTHPLYDENGNNVEEAVEDRAQRKIEEFIEREVNKKRMNDAVRDARSAVERFEFSDVV